MKDQEKKVRIRRVKKEKFKGKKAETCKPIDWEDISLNKDSDRKDGWNIGDKAITSSSGDKIVIRSDELSDKKPAAASSDGKGKRVRIKRTGVVSDKSVKRSSDFRKKSADWKNSESRDVERMLLNDESFSFAHLIDKIMRFSALQWAVCGMALILLVSGIMTTAVYAGYRGEQNRTIAFDELESYEKAATMELLQQTEEIVEAPIAAEEAKPQLGKVLTLVLSSVEKDLKIKLVDEDDTLVRGVPWSVTITSGEGDESQEEDDDKDGIIHMTELTAGDYSVTLNPSDELADYKLPEGSQVCSVKAKVEYKVIADIKEEIKSEKEVNAAAEDANGNQAADVETGPVLTDTVEWVESTKTASGEDQYVAATVDLSKTASIERKNPLLVALNGIRNSVRSVISKDLAFGLKPVLSVADENVTDPEVQDQPTGDTNDEPNDSSNNGTDEGGGGDSSGNGSGDNSGTGSGNDSENGNSGDSGSGTNTPTNGDNNSNSETPTKYTLTVTNGSGGGSYEAGEKVSITANSPASGKKFSIWTATSGSFADASSSTTTFTMPAGDATVLANYADSVEASIAISGPSSVKVGATTTLKAAVTPASDTVTWKSSDTGVAAISASGDTYTLTVKGVKAGTSTITATSKSGKSATLTVTVSSDEYKDDAQLKDSENNALYVKDGDSYRLAKYKDYKEDPARKFYKKIEGFLYTGWQTINGNTYYYKKDHSYVTGDQVIGGVTYHFTDDGILKQGKDGSGILGIDVSKYQPSINWSSVKSSGVSYVIIRCGYRGSSTGVLVEDPYFKSHIKGAKAVGLKVGVYFFTTALTEAEAVEEASMCSYLCSGYGVNYPVFMDVESSNRPGWNGMSASQRTAIIQAFCNTIRSAGYTPGVYANKTWLTSYMNAGSLSGYKIWLAQYNSSGPTYSGKYDLWQYTSKGSVSGISGNVDMNQSYLGY